MKLSIAALVLFVSLSIAPTVFAQSTPSAHHAQLDVDLELHPIDHELDSIDAESATATALYVTGTIVTLTGAGIMVGAAIAQSSPFVGGGDYSQTIDAGLGIGIVGLVALGFAIGLDVDSGSRRRAHGTQVALMPSRDGGMLSISRTF